MMRSATHSKRMGAGGAEGYFIHSFAFISFLPAIAFASWKKTSRKKSLLHIGAKASAVRVLSHAAVAVTPVIDSEEEDGNYTALPPPCVVFAPAPCNHRIVLHICQFASKRRKAPSKKHKE